MTRQIVAALTEDLGKTWAVWSYDGPKRGESSLLANGSRKIGTTWMCRILGSLPGYNEIGNLRQDLVAFRAVEPSSAIHGHEPYSPELVNILAEKGIRMILMVRNPRDQAV